MSEFVWPKLSEVVAEVRKAAAESPDHVYEPHEVGPSCTYVRKGEGGELEADCIVGQGLARAGVPLYVLAKFDVGDDTSAARKLGEVYPGDRDWPKIRWLSLVQGGQDTFRPWGEAVDRASELTARG